MELLIPAALVVGGLLLLAGGGEALVRGATSLARLAGLTPAVIGLTVVAMGTSLPELVVSLIAAFRGQPDLTVGNVVGSNIFNIAAILGITAMIRSLPVHGNAVRLEWPFMFVASFVALLLSRDGQLDRIEGGFFVLTLVLFVAYTVRLARREVANSEAAAFSDEVDAHSLHSGPRQLTFSLLLVVGGMLLLMFGGRLLVDGAVELARAAGLTERVIGLTVVAAGTSAPELAASAIAALRNRTDVAVANLIGSNIFNILGIFGTTALITPVPVSPGIIASDMWWMLGTSFVLLPMMATGRVVKRWEGALLFGVFVTYLVLLLR